MGQCIITNRKVNPVINVNDSWEYTNAPYTLPKTAYLWRWNDSFSCSTTIDGVTITFQGLLLLPKGTIISSLSGGNIKFYGVKYI